MEQTRELRNEPTYKQLTSFQQGDEEYTMGRGQSL
jgi:hypothetical protein